MRKAPALTFLCLLIGSPALQATPEKDAILSPALRRIETSDFRASGRLIRVNGSERATYKFSVKGHWFPDGLHVLYEFSDPAIAANRFLLHMDTHGRITVSEMKTGQKTSTHVPSEKEVISGTGVSYEDLVEAQFFWTGQTAGDSASYGPRHCTNLKSIPTNPESSRYSAVTSCVDQTIGYPLHVTKTFRSTGHTEDFSYSGIRQSSGVWTATQIKIDAVAGQGSTLLLIDHGSAKAKLGLPDFDMTRPFSAGEE